MTLNDGRIRIAVLCGSVRPGNYTRMATVVVVAFLSANPDVSVDVVDSGPFGASTFPSRD
jgi:NAD(P)H-dependent FMN reductase